MPFFLRSSFALLALGLFSTAAHADTIETLNLNAVLRSGSATGSIIFDETTGMFTGGSIQVVNGSTTYIFSAFEPGGTTNTATFAHFFDALDNLTFQLNIPGPSDIGYTGGSVCSETSHSGCLAGSSYYYTGFVLPTSAYDLANSGTLTPTPEPSSLILLGTGLVGLMGVARQRFGRSRA